MTVQFLLLIILFGLMTFIGGKRGARAFFSLLINFFILFIGIVFMVFNADPMIVTIICCILIGSMTLFYTSGFNDKTIASLISIVVVLMLTMILVYKLGYTAKLQGFGKEEAETIGSYSLYIHTDFMKLVFCTLLFGIVGAITDVSITISSSMNEIYLKNQNITRKKLYESGLNIGRDIIGAMTNTLLFAYIGGFMTLIIWFDSLHYSIVEILNDKIFCSEIFQSLGGAIGIILIIPVTAFVTSMFLVNNRRKTPKNVMD